MKPLAFGGVARLLISQIFFRADDIDAERDVFYEAAGIVESH